MTPPKTVLYLSAAPRVSTRPDAELGSPRTHVLGVIGALEGLGWHVQRYIVGDRVPASWRGSGSQTRLRRSVLTKLAADGVRLTLGALNAVRAWQQHGSAPAFVYERAAVMSALGWLFRWRGVPWILETNGLLYVEAKIERGTIVLGGLARWLEFRAYHACNLVVCPSQTLKDLIVEQAGVPAAKVYVMTNAVDTHLFDPATQPPRRLFPQDTFIVGFVGTAYRWQGLGLLLDAVAALRDEGRDIAVTVVGGGEQVDALQARYAAAEWVCFVGVVPLSEVPAYIAGIDAGYSGQVMMATGNMYHSPLKLYEYTAMGVPVIASDYPDARRITQGGTLGYLFTPDDPHSLRTALHHAMDALPHRPQHQQQLRDIALNNNWQARVQALLAHMQQAGILHTEATPT